MKKKTPSNPLPPAESLNLSLNAGTVQPPPSQNSAQPKRPPKRKGRRKSARSIRSSGASSRADSESRWQRIKGRLAAKIGQIEPDELRETLLGLAVTAGVAAAVVIVVKTLPLAVTVLAILGLALTLKLWQQIRFLPRPF
jgi:Flp pilus assembly protein TadB